MVSQVGGLLPGPPAAGLNASTMYVDWVRAVGYYDVPGPNYALPSSFHVTWRMIVVGISIGATIATALAIWAVLARRTWRLTRNARAHRCGPSLGPRS
jgi:hypothetical protein